MRLRLWCKRTDGCRRGTKIEVLESNAPTQNTKIVFYESVAQDIVC